MENTSLASAVNEEMMGSDDEWNKFVNQAQAARATGNFSFAEYLWMAAVEEAEMQGGDLKLPVSLDGLAESFWQQGKLRQAEIAARRAFELYGQLLSPGHLDIGVAANNLAMIYHWQQKYGQAEPLYKQSLEIKTKNLGSNHPDVGVVLSHYAKLLQETHREDQATHMLSCSGGVQTGKWLPTERMKSLAATGNGSSSSTTPNANSGTQGQPVSPQGPPASVSYGQAPMQSAPNTVAIANSYPAQSPSGAPVDQGTARFENPQSELDFLRMKVQEYEATIRRQETQLRELMAQSQRRPEVSSVSSISESADKMTSWETAMNGAKAAFDLGRYDEAHMFLEKAMALAGELQEQDPRRTATLDALGECLFRQDKYGQAEIIWQRSLNTKRQFLGTYHKDVAETANNLARLHYQLARFQEAEFLAIKCIEIYTAVNGERSLEVASATHNLATLYHVQGQYELAEKAYKTAVDIRTQILGTEHPDTAILMKNYADLLAVTGRTTEAEQIHGQATGLITGSWKALQFDMSTRLEE